MDKKRINYSVPEGYFEQLQERLRAIPSQQAEVASTQQTQSESGRNWIRPVMGWAAGIAAALAVGVFAFRDSGREIPGVTEVPSYEQYAIADLIPRTDPYIYYEEESQAPVDPTEEEMIDYLMQYQNDLP